MSESERRAGTRTPVRGSASSATVENPIVETFLQFCSGTFSCLSYQVRYINTACDQKQPREPPYRFGKHRCTIDGATAPSMVQPVKIPIPVLCT